MSIMHFDATTAAAAVGVSLSLSGGNANSTAFKNAQAGFRFNSNGTVDKITTSGAAQIAAGTDWIETGTTFTAADYEVLWHETFNEGEGGGGAALWVSNSWTEDTFLPLSLNRSVQYQAFYFGGGELEPIAPEIGLDNFVWLEVAIRYQDGSSAVRNPELVTFATDAQDLTIGDTYEIAVLGDGDWTTVGAASNTIGVRFTATGTTAGGTTGTCRATCAEKSSFAGYQIYLNPY